MTATTTARTAAGAGAPTRHAGARTAWMVAGSVLAAGAIGWGTFNVIDLLAHEVTTDRLTFPAEGIARVRIDNGAGSVVVVPADGDVITVDARIETGLRDTGTSAVVRGDTLEVRGTCPNLGGTWCEVAYEIAVPATVALEIDSANDRVTVTGMRGPVSVDSDNGTITVTDVTGPLVLSADNGRIRATGVRSTHVRADSDNGRIEITMASPPEQVVARSDNGRVDIVVPDTADSYAVITRTDNGDARNGVRTDPASTRTIDVSTDNGDITIRYPS